MTINEYQAQAMRFANPKCLNIFNAALGLTGEAGEFADLIKPGSIIEETVNCDRTTECGCGINVAPLEWVRREGCNQPYKLLIRWEWLLGVVVPYNTDGKIRCSKAQILEAVE